MSVGPVSSHETLTKHGLISDIAKTFDVLDWFSPVIITMKILLQCVWKSKVDWDDPVPADVQRTWKLWRSQLDLLTTKHTSRCYYPKDKTMSFMELHGFSDASEAAYDEVIYLCMIDTAGLVHMVLVTSKTKVAPSGGSRKLKRGFPKTKQGVWGQSPSEAGGYTFSQDFHGSFNTI